MSRSGTLSKYAFLCIQAVCLRTSIGRGVEGELLTATLLVYCLKLIETALDASSLAAVTTCPSATETIVFCSLGHARTLNAVPVTVICPCSAWTKKA